MRNLIGIYNENGKKISSSTLNLVGFKLIIPSPSYSVVEETLDDGSVIVIDKHLLPRNITARFYSKSDDYIDSLLSRDMLYEILSDGSEIYVSEEKNTGKRWKVHVDGWTPERANLRVKHFEIPMRAISGTAESVNIIKRKYDTKTFTFKNEGNVPINMRRQSETTIIFKGASNGLTIKNLTTSDIWKYNGLTTENDEIKLIGVRSLKNGQSIFGDTNHKMIDFAPGINKFEISGTIGDFELNITTRFYFL